MRCGIDGLASLVQINITWIYLVMPFSCFVEEFFDWLESFYAMKGKLQTAVIYALNQKVELLSFLGDGNLEASNNLAEQVIRPIAIDRKNSLFSTSMKRATANAMAYTSLKLLKRMD